MATNPKIRIVHIATGLWVEFDDYFFNEFQDTIDTKYNSTETYGRMDPIMNYQGATRKISLGIQIVPGGATEREALHINIARLQKMQYPVYENGANALTIQRPPIVAVSLANLIRDGNGQPLICAMNGFGFTPKAGFTPEDSPYVRFGEERIGGAAETAQTSEVNSTDAAASPKIDNVGFKNYTLKFDLTPLHQSTLGFQNFKEGGDGPTDPDADSTPNPNMKFLGGFVYGPVDQRIALAAGGGIKVFSPDPTDANVQELANVQDIFDKIGFGATEEGS